MDGPKSDERIVAMVKDRYVKCDNCDGCGAVVDYGERIPWCWYTLPLPGMDGAHHEKAACAKCRGTGQIPARLQYRTRKKRITGDQPPLY